MKIQKDVMIEIQDTPNPQTKKFIFNTQLVKEPIEFIDGLSANASPLASKIFGFPWATSVYIGENFVSVTKQDWVDWELLQSPISQLLLDHIKSGEPIIIESSMVSSSSDILESDTEEVKKIKTIINRDIRPFVAMDGGDITFSKYEDHIVYVAMRGACSGCPSSQVTLKDGVERLLKQALPKIQGIVAISSM